MDGIVEYNVGTRRQIKVFGGYSTGFPVTSVRRPSLTSPPSQIEMKARVAVKQKLDRIGVSAFCAR